MEPNTDLQEEIIRFFSKNPSPNEEAVINFAVQLGLEPNIVKKEIYNLLSHHLTQITNNVVSRSEKENDVAVILNTKELIDNLVGKIDGYYLNGFYYEHNRDDISIDGREVLEEILEKMTKDFEVGDQKTKIIMDASQLYEYMNYGSVGYSVEDANEDFIEDPIGVLFGMKKSLGSQVNPYTYEKEPEYIYEEQPPEEYEELDYEEDDLFQ